MGPPFVRYVRIPDRDTRLKSIAAGVAESAAPISSSAESPNG